MDNIWTQERVDELGKLWTEGLSTAEIGRRLGITKNSVVGKAHRLELAPRPSPVKLTGKPRQKPAPKVVEITGPTCSWPHGHPGEKGFHFCGARAITGKPYCAEHAAIAYVRPKSQGSSSNAA
ncbi:MAG: GcrA cell cycle regulator [Aliidongia sp.]|jgi:GcrA cell cycle regulator|nr:GcrA cell cycle regulator [Aliidongia sp.]